MPVINKSAISAQPCSPSTILIENNDDDSQVRVALLQQNQIKPQHQQRNLEKLNMNTISSLASITNRTPSNLLELKQQRLLEAADRKKRIITRIITVIGLLIMLLCAAIVAFTLKMAPKIDELVRTKTGTHQFIHLMSRMSTPSTTIELNNFTTNSSSIDKFTFRTPRRSFI